MGLDRERGLEIEANYHSFSSLCFLLRWWRSKNICNPLVCTFNDTKIAQFGSEMSKIDWKLTRLKLLASAKVDLSGTPTSPRFHCFHTLLLLANHWNTRECRFAVVRCKKPFDTFGKKVQTSSLDSYYFLNHWRKAWQNAWKKKRK
jgi:hypothetical protein